MRATTVIFVVGISGLAQAANSFSTSPFAQRATTTDAYLHWVQSAGTATVTYGPKGGATATANEAATSDNHHNLHLTGLTASTRYAYTVDLGGGVTAAGEFSTAATAGEAFSFIVYGDNRTDNTDHQTVVNAMKKESVDFLIETGDVCEFPVQSYYDTYFGIEKDLLAQNVLFETLGNHEYASGIGTSLWKSNFYFPDKEYYSFDWGNARFVVLDFNENISTQTTWMDGVMADARTKGIEHLFVVLHWSPFDSGDHDQNTARQADWVPVMKKYNVEMIFGGHDHDYERGLDSASNIRYVIAGGGGAPLYTTNHMYAYQQKFESTLNYVKVAIAGSMVTVSAFRGDGSALDSFSYSTAASSTGGTGGTSGGSSAGTSGGSTGSTGGSTAGTSGGSTGSTGGNTGTTGGSTTSGGTTGTTGSMGSGASGGCSAVGSGSFSGAFILVLAVGFLARRRRA